MCHSQCFFIIHTPKVFVNSFLKIFYFKLKKAAFPLKKTFSKALFKSKFKLFFRFFVTLWMKDNRNFKFVKMLCEKTALVFTNCYFFGIIYKCIHGNNIL